MSREMEALAARVEALTGACRETDAAIARAIGFGLVAQEWHNEKLEWHAWEAAQRWGPWEVLKPYTASLDAAVSLVPEGACWRLDTMTGNAFVYRPFGGLNERGVAATPALALTAATLRARAAQEPT